MRNGRRERIEKGSRERIVEKRERDKPPFIEFSRSDLSFYKLIECIIQNNVMV